MDKREGILHPFSALLNCQGAVASGFIHFPPPADGGRDGDDMLAHAGFPSAGYGISAAEVIIK